MSALIELRSVTDALLVLERVRDDLIHHALADGHSEREVGRAANMSGPAINQRKRRASHATSDQQATPVEPDGVPSWLRRSLQEARESDRRPPGAVGVDPLSENQRSGS